VFDGSDRGAHRDAIVLNAALALEVAGIVPDAASGIEAASAALDRGDGTRILGRLSAFGSTLSATR
jgi:anthranilate phosphoribosyltransferase